MYIVDANNVATTYAQMLSFSATTNSFKSLEPNNLKAISERPLLATEDQQSGTDGVHECLKWPDFDSLMPIGFLDRTKDLGFVVILVEDLKLALRKNEAEDGFVTAEEVESRVRELMDSDEGE
ncbi:Glycosyltransferase [Forsythia ovata]|uniref:Glycosyltransferase n=1 Tax=Forsythia ovata TaxID=205694 RepID=A0ABD1VLR3_9LAMI